MKEAIESAREKRQHPNEKESAEEATQKGKKNEEGKKDSGKKCIESF